MNGLQTYRLTIDPPVGATPVDEPHSAASISCASPCSESALVLIRANDDIEHAEVTVHNIAGRRVATILSAPVPAGTTPVRWDTTKGGASSLPSGVYFVRMRAGEDTAHAMFVLVR